MMKANGGLGGITTVAAAVKQPCDEFPQHFPHKPGRQAITLDQLQIFHIERCMSESSRTRPSKLIFLFR